MENCKFHMSPDRRTFLRTVGAAGVGVATAGCSGGGDTNDGNDNESNGGNGDGPGGGVPTVITMKAGGADIWNQVDLGHFYYAQVSGDFDVAVEVTSLENVNPHAKAGIMVRESLEPASRNVMVRKRAGFELSPQWRSQDNSSTTSTTSEQGQDLSRVEGGTMAGDWVRLERTGDTVRAYGSENGEDWTLMVELPASEVEFSDQVYVGLAATSHNQAEATTAKFRNLSGLEPTDNQDIGSPIVSGSVSVAKQAVISTVEPSSLSSNAATITGNLENLGGAEEVTVRFEYKEVTADEWQETETTTVSETGEVGIDVSGLTPRRYYQFRAYADNGDTEAVTVNDLFSTPSGSSGSSSDGPRSAALHDPADGFADFAPWADDDTPLVVVDEASREALEAATNIDGPRIVVFETSGTIDLGAEDLNIRNDQCWVAGQTAPSPGITLIRGGVWLYGDECVLQHLRVRPGDAGQSEGWQPDAIECADDTQGNIVDHCTGTWSIDENINVGYDTNESTLSNCLMAEPLNDATHPKGEHGYNSIIGDRAKNVAAMGNVYGLSTDRNPRLKQGTRTVVVNNLVHHYHDGMWADPDTKHSIVGNVFEDPHTDQPNVFGEGSVYAEDNVQRDDASNPMIGDAITPLSSRPLWPDAMEAAPSGDVYDTNLANAGARPVDRTATDQRIIENIRNGGGGVIDSQDDVGGYPELAENTASIDEPTSGLVAWLREQALAVEQ